MIKGKIAGLTLGGVAGFLLINKAINVAERSINSVCEASKWRNYYKHGHEGRMVPPGYSSHTHEDEELGKVTIEKDGSHSAQKASVSPDSFSRILDQIFDGKGNATTSEEKEADSEANNDTKVEPGTPLKDIPNELKHKDYGIFYGQPLPEKYDGVCIKNCAGCAVEECPYDIEYTDNQYLELLDQKYPKTIRTPDIQMKPEYADPEDNNKHQGDFDGYHVCVFDSVELISILSYYKEQPDYEKIHIDWYRPDNVWINEMEEIIPDIQNYVGLDVVSLFDRIGPDDDFDVRCVRNHERRTDYEILRHHQTFVKKEEEDHESAD